MIVGIGIDLCEVARVERELRGGGAEFARSLFTEAELASYLGRARRADHLAARFAAKEAVAKSLALDGSCGAAWRLIEILDAPAGAPSVRLNGAVATAAERLGVRSIRVALAGDRRLAAATAIAETESGERGSE